MSIKNRSRLQKAIENVESLPVVEQEELVEIIGKRLTELRRADLIARVQESRDEIYSGDYKSGDIDALFHDLNS